VQPGRPDGGSSESGLEAQAGKRGMYEELMEEVVSPVNVEAALPVRSYP